MFPSPCDDQWEIRGLWNGRRLLPAVKQGPGLLLLPAGVLQGLQR